MDKRQIIREQLAQELNNSWKGAGYKGFCRISPGAGKSKMMLDIIKEHVKEFSNARVLILVPNTVLKDKTFIEEVELWWNLKDFKKYCTISCWQSYYKIAGEHFTLGLFDEGDAMLSEKYIKAYTENVFDKVMCLSGTFTEEKMELAYEYFNTMLLDYPVSVAQEEGLINKTKIHVVPIPLLVTNTVKKKNGYWSEHQAYRWIDSMIENSKKASFQHKHLMEQARTIPEYEEHKKNWVAAFNKKKQFESGYGFKYSRTNFTYTLESLGIAAKKLKEQLLIEADNKVLIFAKRTASIDQVTEHVYYKDKGKDNIDKFNDGEIRELGLCKRNRGVNYKGLNNIIFHSFDSSHSEATQALTRAVRLDTDQIADIYFLVSYYPLSGKEIAKCRNFTWFLDIMNGLGFKYDVVNV
jgi:hypothetical protein